MNDRDCENCKHHTKKGCDSWDCNFERRMTREDAIKQLKTDGCYECAYGCENVVDCTAKGCKYKEAFLMAINSLEIDERYELEYEQIEPCEDAISRQAVIDATVKINSIWNKITNSKGENLEEIILQLPPVNPQEPRKGCLSIDDVMSVFDDFMCGEVDEDGTETFLEMLKDKAESEGKE